MSENRLIRAPKGYWTRCLREEFVAACGNLCAAMILSQHEYWHRHNQEQRKQSRYRNQVAANTGQPATEYTGLWCAMSHADMKAELFDLFGKRAIGEAYKILLAKGFLTQRQNPASKWDRKPQYLFMTDAVQVAVEALPKRREDEQAEETEEAAPVAETTPQNCGEEAAIMRNGAAPVAETTPPERAVILKNLPQNAQQNIRQSRAPTPQPRTQPAQAAKDRSSFSSSQGEQRALSALGEEQQRVNRSGAAKIKAALEAAVKGKGGGDGRDGGGGPGVRRGVGSGDGGDTGGAVGTAAAVKPAGKGAGG